MYDNSILLSKLKNNFFIKLSLQFLYKISNYNWVSVKTCIQNIFRFWDNKTVEKEGIWSFSCTKSVEKLPFCSFNCAVIRV